jgi:adenylate cyclase
VPGYTSEALAERAGVDVSYVDRLVELGILVPSETGRSFSEGDFRRTRLLRALEDGGLPLEGIATVVRNGEFSFAFMDLPSWDWYGGFVEKTYRQLSAETGLSLELVQSVRESMGSARPDPDDFVHEEALELIPLLKVGLEAGADSGAIERLARVWGESVRRIVEAAAAFYQTEIERPLRRSGMSESQVMQTANEAVMAGIPHTDRAIVSMYHAHSEHTWMANVVEAVEATLDQAGLYHTVAESPAMTVKWLGDGVMIYYSQPDAAVLSALELVEAAPATGLPPVHAGIDTGPVFFQDGDYFGRTVNTAARIAAHAVPGEVLVSDDVARRSRDPGLRFEDIGPVDLNGVPEPIRLHRASHRRSDGHDD